MGVQDLLDAPDHVKMQTEDDYPNSVSFFQGYAEHIQNQEESVFERDDFNPLGNISDQELQDSVLHELEAASKPTERKAMNEEHIDKETGEILEPEEAEQDWQGDIRIEQELAQGKIPDELISDYGYFHFQSQKYALTSMGMSDIALRLQIGTVESSIVVTETPLTFSVHLIAKNFETGVTRYGSATEYKFEAGKFPNKKIPEDFKPPEHWETHKYANVHARPTAITRAEKNGMDKLIPAHYSKAAIKLIQEADMMSDNPKNPKYKGYKRKMEQEKQRQEQQQRQQQQSAPELPPPTQNGGAEQPDSEEERLRKRAFALFRENEVDLENYGLPKELFWQVVKFQMQVESRSDMTPAQWKNIGDWIEDQATWADHFPITPDIQGENDDEIPF